MAEQTEKLGPFRYTWDEECFPLGQDSLALAAFCTLRPRQRVCDLGCGAGALLISLFSRERTLAVSGVEIDPHAAELARRNLAENNLTGEIITGDLSLRAQLPPAGRWDLVVANPPYFAAGSGADGGPGRMEQGCTPENLCGAAAYLLKNGGRFGLVHRPERLCDLFCALRGAELEVKRMKLLSHRPDKAPYAVLLEAVRRGRPGLEILP